MALPPAQPAYIFRGHSSQIYATAFIRKNTRLVTGDADGWIVIWCIATKRPVTVWRAHEGPILGVSAWGDDKLITHGKDNKLIAWKLSAEDEASMSRVLPVDTPPEPRKQPWLVNILEVNTMNFCSFAQSEVPSSGNYSSQELLVAVPNTMGSEAVDIFHLPSARRIHTIPASLNFKGGMVMAVSIFYHPQTYHLMVIAGYESGHTSVSQVISSTWQTLYTAQAHTQPILSLDVSSTKHFYFTSSADAIIAKHPIPASQEHMIMPVESIPLKTLQTKHAGQQSLRIRNDGKIFATAGWDSRVRVYSVNGLKELAVLKWHKEGCYTVAFADVPVITDGFDDRSLEGKELLKRIGTTNVQQERLLKAKTSHWLATGSKDGKVSLWEIY